MLFFQAVLLCGYAYALLVSRWPLKRQLIAQLAILCLAFISLPIGLSSSWANSVPPSDNPSLWLLMCLAASVGLPFFIVSSNSPLLQKWFSRTATESARDPYFLYSASNAGSLLALLAYPVLMEPFFTLRAQGRLWTIGYARARVADRNARADALAIKEATSQHWLKKKRAKRSRPLTVVCVGCCWRSRRRA